MSKYSIILLLACLSACGMKGPLQLPPGPPPEPLLGNPRPAATPTPATPAETAPKDVSTDKKPSSQ